MTRYKLLVAHSYTEELDKSLVLKKALVPMLPQELSLLLSAVELDDDDSLEDSLEVEEDDDELELDDLDEALGLLDDDCLVPTLTWTLA